MKFKRTILVVTALIIPIILIFTAGCSSSNEKTSQTQQSPSVKAKVMVLGLQDVPITEDVVGTVISKNQARISSKVMGTIESIYVKEGDWVKQGQKLARLDARDLQPNVDKASAGLQEVADGLMELDKVNDEILASRNAAQANFDYASTSLHRYQNLYDRQAISKEMLDETVRQYKLAEANLATVSAKQQGLVEKRKQLLAKQKQVNSDLELAKTYLGYASINSPISGLVVQKFIDTGSMASPGQPIYLVESPEYQFQAAVKESLSPYIKIGMKTPVQLDTINQTLEGSIVEIIPSSDPMSRTFSVKIALPKTTDLRSGTYGKAKFPMGNQSKLVIPKTAVIEHGSLQGVYALDSAQLTRYRLIKTGMQFNDLIEITAGLQPGDQILVSNIDQIQDGTKVEVVE